MSADKERELIELVRRSPQPKRATITELGLSRSTFCRWQRRYREQGEAGLMDRKPEPGAVWNRLRSAEKTAILETALQRPDLSPRELALSHHRPRRIHSLGSHRVPGAETVRPGPHDHTGGFPAGKEFRVKQLAHRSGEIEPRY